MSTAKEMFRYDLHRYYPDGRSFTSVLSQGRNIPYLKALRHAQYDKGLLKFFWRMRLRRLQIRTGMQISHRTKVGKGLYIGHVGPIAVNENAQIGENCNLTFGVVIGADNRGKRKGAPCIGNRVWIGTNAVVVGKITIGDDVLIAPGALVNFDVPAHSVVIGNPGTIHPRTNATEGFINHVV